MFKQSQMFFQKLRWYVAYSVSAGLWHITFSPFKWETGEFFTFSPPYKDYGTVPLAPSERSFLRLIKLFCFSCQRFFLVRAVTIQYVVVTKGLKKPILSFSFLCFVAIRSILVYAPFQKFVLLQDLYNMSNWFLGWKQLFPLSFPPLCCTISFSS